MPTELITPHGLADRWRVSVGTLSQWRWSGRGPQYLKLGGRIMYRLEDIKAFEEARTRHHTAQDFNQVSMI